MHSMFKLSLPQVPDAGLDTLQWKVLSCKIIKENAEQTTFLYRLAPSIPELSTMCNCYFPQFAIPQIPSSPPSTTNTLSLGINKMLMVPLTSLQHSLESIRV